MSGEQRRPDAPRSGPAWSLDLVAELHAGALDPDTADEVRSRAADDPEARDLLAALEATREDLAGLPSPRMPDAVASRLDAALDAEIQSWAPPAPVVPIEAARQRGGRRRSRWGWTAGLLGVAAAVTGVLVLTTTLLGGRPVQQAGELPSATLPQDPPPLALRGQSTLEPAQLAEVLGSRQYGTLSDPERLLGCLQANGVTSGNPLGAREVTINGEPARLLVLPGGGLGRFRLLVVGPDCGPGNPATISDSTLGG